MERAHKKLDVWGESVALVTEIYGLMSQMRRAAVSVLSNIAEGAARRSNKEFAQFLNIAGGSLSELYTQVKIAANLGYLAQKKKTKY